MVSAHANVNAESVIRRYLDCMVAHDWETMAECLDPDVVRVGPFGDTYSQRAPYVDFLASLLPTLISYNLTVSRVLSSGSLVIVELTESMELNGSMDVTREVLLFETNDGNLITRIDIFIQRRP